MDVYIWKKPNGCMLRTGNFIICKFILNAIDFLDYWTFPKLAS